MHHSSYHHGDNVYRYPPYEADRGTEKDRASSTAFHQHSWPPQAAPIESEPQPTHFSSPALFSPTLPPCTFLPTTPLELSLSPSPHELSPFSLPSPPAPTEPQLAWPTQTEVATAQSSLLSHLRPPTPPRGPAPVSSSSSPSSPTLSTRRQKQRRADMQRRKREAAALDELKLLITAAEVYTADACKEQPVEASDEADRRQRVQVLEGSTASMRLLLQMVHTLKRTCEEQKQAVEWLEAEKRWRDTATQPSALCTNSSFARSTCASAKRVRLLASAVERSLDSSLGRDALHSSANAPIGLAVALLDCTTGRALDISQEFAVMLGWKERSQLIGTQVTQSADSVLNDQWDVGPLSHPQYGRSKRVKQELYKGLIDVGKMMLRMRCADGKVYELHSTSWIDEWQTVTDAEGRPVGRRPLRVVGVLSTDHKMLVDDPVECVTADK